ncbi:MAG: preprotein translocase subunit SecA [Chloroflexota bacterium]
MFKWFNGLLDSNEKELKRLQPIVARINSLEPEFQKLTDAELRARTDQFRSRFKNGETLDQLLPEAFAAVREAARRTIGQRHYDVQLLGGMVLHHGKIAEMKTGEGKTLVATLPLYLNSLAGEGCHLVTVNDYLARRDAHWMGAIYHALGVSVAAIHGQETAGLYQPSYLYDPAHVDSNHPSMPHLRPVSRREAYQADITYGTNNEFGFDYLRDNMVVDPSQCVQRPLNYAIVDEVDNILIDEARTPLIISGSAQDSNEKRRKQMEEYRPFARIAAQLREGSDYEIDAKSKSVTLTNDGDARVDRLLRTQGLLRAESRHELEAHPENAVLVHRIDNAVRAQVIFKKDRDYVVDPKEGVIIVDEFTGRKMFGRRYSDGLHEALEAKEGVVPRREMETLATVTFQNFFRMYKKLAGMTGTALTEAEEFFKIYKLEVVVIPTNRPMVREDNTDQIYKDEAAKFKAAANEIEKYYKEGRPVLVGTVSIEKSEVLSDLLNKRGIPHQVLNAKHHEKEAAIIAQAGRIGAVTVATNMAGRGVDIILGGNPEGQDPKEWQTEHDRVVSLGGLHIVGTERHEARRIDNQLRGRAGRQGDPGSTRFYISLEDDVIKRFGGERVKGIMEWAGFDENTPIEHGMVSKAIENAQVRTEGYHFDIRKHLVEYDDVINKHREVIYEERRKAISGTDLKANIQAIVNREIDALAAAHYGTRLDPDVLGLLQEVSVIFPLAPDMTPESLTNLGKKEVVGRLKETAKRAYEEREGEFGAENMRVVERLVMLRAIDEHWKEHLNTMEDMRQEVGLHAIAQERPVTVYQREGFRHFNEMMASIQHDVVRMIFRVRLEKKGEPPPPKAAVPASKTVGRNDPCPCGSGKKYKKCCGR